MPYNSSAIPPAEDITGQSALPLSRVKKIIRLDDEVNGCSNNAAFLVAVAAEMFIQYLAEQGLKITQGERKQRKTMQYKDLAGAVARIDNLEFLADVIPPTVPFKQIREKKNKGTKETEAGQPQLVMAGGQKKILPIGASTGPKKNETEKGKSKAVVIPEINSTLAGNEAPEEDETEKMVEDEDRAMVEPTRSKDSGLGRFVFDKSKNRDS